VDYGHPNTTNSLLLTLVVVIAVISVSVGGLLYYLGRARGELKAMKEAGLYQENRSG